MAHNRLCIYIIHYVQFIILGENPGIWKLWTDYEQYELSEPLMKVTILKNGWDIHVLIQNHYFNN